MKAQHVSVSPILSASTSTTSFNPHNNPDKGAYFSETETESPKD